MYVIQMRTAIIASYRYSVRNVFLKPAHGIREDKVYLANNATANAATII
jgi:hypothetical protein